MDTYLLIKTLHVLFVVIWIGGDFSFLVFSIRAERKGDFDGFVGLIPNILFFAQYVATPTSIGALICGVAMVLAAWSFTDLWILIGLAGLLTVVVSGVGFLRPRTGRLLDMAEKSGTTPALEAQAREIMRLVKFDHLVMFLVIADMVLKPTSGDYGVWGPMLVVLLLGAAIFLGPVRALRHA